jgi:hypothetical protein
LKAAKLKKVVRAYEMGTDVKTIAGQVGVSPPTVAKWLTNEGYKRKKKGRIPLAMKARVNDLHQRNWTDDQIAGFLKLSVEQVRSFYGPRENPGPLGGEKDPLKIQGGRKRKQLKAKGKKRGRPRKEEKPKGATWPPPRHKCRKHWTPVEESYVMQLMEKKVAPAVIYKRMRASRARQRRIWKKYGGKGNPPNFPPPKGPYTPPPSPPTTAEAKKRRAEALALEQESLTQLKQLEIEAAERQRKIAELEAQAEADKLKLKEAAKIQRKAIREARDELEKAKAAKKITKRLRELPEPRKRVLPGSYEAEVEGRKVGSLIKPKKRGRKALPAVGLGRYADNGRYFTVSTRWPQLKKASADEVALYAAHLDSKGFPARATRSGDLPQGYIQERWPDKIDARWEKVNGEALTLVKRLRERKLQIKKKKQPSPAVLRYLSAVYDAYRSPNLKKLNKKQREALREEVIEQFARAKKIDRRIMIYSMGIAKPDGSPTPKGIDRSFSARAMVEKASRRAASRLSEEKKIAAKQGKAAKQLEQERIQDIRRKALEAAPTEDEEDDDDW